MKRLFDIVASGLGLLVLSPLLGFVALWIKFDSPGPVFFRQVRVGRNNIDFRIFKFRTMRPDSDKKGLITVGGRDPRVTRSGYYIRKYKLDEFPQLINVFVGDMSLVGPRPEVRKYVDMYSSEQMRILDVRPGITSLASIRYKDENELLANAANPEKVYIEQIMPDKIKIDLEYVAKAGLLTDIRLIFSTFKEVF